MHFQYFPALSECWEGVQNDKRGVQAGPEQSGYPAHAAKHSPETLLKVPLPLHVEDKIKSK